MTPIQSFLNLLSKWLIILTAYIWKRLIMSRMKEERLFRFHKKIILNRKGIGWKTSTSGLATFGVKVVNENKHRTEDIIRKNKNVKSISSGDSQLIPGLQFVDNICSVIRLKICNNDKNDYYSIIENLVHSASNYHWYRYWKIMN